MKTDVILNIFPREGHFMSTMIGLLKKQLTKLLQRQTKERLKRKKYGKIKMINGIMIDSTNTNKLPKVMKS